MDILPSHLFSEAVEQAQVAIAITNHKLDLLYANPNFERVTGYNSTVSKDESAQFLKTIKEAVGNRWEHLCAQGGQLSDQEVYFEPGGYHHPRWFIYSGTWFCQHDNNTLFGSHRKDYFLLIAKEITTIKRQQEELHKNALRAKLAEEELTEGIRETLAGALHQLQEPVNIISAALTMLKRRANERHDPLSTTLQETLTSVNQAIEQLHQCIPDKTFEPLLPVNLNELLHDILTISTQRLLAEGVVIDWKPKSVLPSWLGYVGRLRGMFKQLIDNSIDSMKNHRLRELRIHTTCDSDLIKVIIEDTGTGIPDNLRFKVFEPFFTTKAGKGIGMGLVTVQEVVNLHAGSIRLDSDYTEGTRFILQFPIK